MWKVASLRVRSTDERYDANYAERFQSAICFSLNDRDVLGYIFKKTDANRLVSSAQGVVAAVAPKPSVAPNMTANPVAASPSSEALELQRLQRGIKFLADEATKAASQLNASDPVQKTLIDALNAQATALNSLLGA